MSEGRLQMTGIGWHEIALGVLGGLALFLLGLQQLTRALQNVASARLRRMLLVFARHPARGAISGAAATAVIQSSTATVVLLVGFVAAGALTLRQAIPVLLGANVGTTLTMQVIAFDIDAFALAMIAVGFAGSSWRRRPQIQGPSRAVLALGLMFLGMTIIATTVEPLRTHPASVQLLTDPSTLAGALLAGALVTAVVQSSSATGGLAIVLVSQGLVDVETALAAMIGASVGTCVTPMIAGLGTSRAGLRVAVAHLLINVVGALMWVWWVPELTAVVRQAPDWMGGGSAGSASGARQLANAYTFYKLATLALLLPASRVVARIVERMVGDSPSVEPASMLDDDMLATSDVALELARRETARLADEVTALVADGVPMALHGTSEDLTTLAARDEKVDAVYARIVEYLGDIGRGELSDEQGDELLAILAAAHNFEAIGDIVETNLVAIGHRRITEGVLPSQPTTEIVLRLHRRVLAALSAARDAIHHKPAAMGASDVLTELDEIEREVRAAFIHLSQRLRADAPNRIRAFEREVEIISQLQGISGLVRHLASPRDLL